MLHNSFGPNHNIKNFRTILKPLIPGGNKKAMRTETNLLLAAAKSRFV